MLGHCGWFPALAYLLPVLRASLIPRRFGSATTRLSSAQSLPRKSGARSRSTGRGWWGSGCSCPRASRR